MSEQYKETLEQRLPEALKKIMSAKEAAENDHSVRTLQLKNGEYELTYVPAIHSNDPKDSLMQEIETRFQEMGPALVVIEGWPDLIDPRSAKDVEIAYGEQNLTRDEYIIKQEERGLAVRLASEHGLPIASPEPLDKTIAQQLMSENISPEDIIGFYVLRGLKQEIRTKKQLPAPAQILWSIEETKKHLGLEHVPYQPSMLQNRLSELTGIEKEKLDTLDKLSEEELTQVFDLTDPIPWEGKPSRTFNKISELINVMRDSFAVAKTAEYLTKYKKVFVTYGGSHLLMQKPALEYLLQN